MSSSSHNAAPRRANTIREEFLSRPRQLVTAQPRLVSAAILDSQWTHKLLQDPEYILLNFQRWFCARCTLVQQAAAISAAQRLSLWKREDLISPTVVNTQDVLHDLTLNGSTNGETFCCGWNVNPPAAAAHGFEASTHHGNALPMRACGCEWTPSSALACMVMTDVLTLGCPCTPMGYLGCGTLICGMQTRWLIRKKYRIIGFGASDFCTMLCCPQCAVEQQSKELSRQGVVLLEAPGPCSMDMS